MLRTLTICIFLCSAPALAQLAPEIIQVSEPTDAYTLCVGSIISVTPEAAPASALAQCRTAGNQMLQTDPRYAFIYTTITTLELRLGNTQAAGEAIQIALRQAPTEAIVQGTYGNYLLSLGDYRPAVEAYNLALANPTANQAALYLNRALALRGLGNYFEAQQDYELYMQLAGFAN